MTTFSTYIRRLSRSGLAAGAPRLGRGISRALFFVFFGVILAWLLYSSVYVPLQQNAELPAGISSQNPALNVAGLQALIKKRNDDASNGSDIIKLTQEQFFRAPVVSPLPTP
jgi:hypothetical protein